VVKALCLGARAVLIGGAYAYGLAAAGEAGVTHAIEILRADMPLLAGVAGTYDTLLIDIKTPDTLPLNHLVSNF